MPPHQNHNSIVFKTKRAKIMYMSTPLIYNNIVLELCNPQDGLFDAILLQRLIVRISILRIYFDKGSFLIF